MLPGSHRNRFAASRIESFRAGASTRVKINVTWFDIIVWLNRKSFKSGARREEDGKGEVERGSEGRMRWRVVRRSLALRHLTPCHVVPWLLARLVPCRPIYPGREQKPHSACQPPRRLVFLLCMTYYPEFFFFPRQTWPARQTRFASRTKQATCGGDSAARNSERCHC